MIRYEQIEHTADLAVKVYGRTKKELFANAAFALCEIMTDRKGLKFSGTEPVEVSAEDEEGLVVAWLNELIYICQVRKKAVLKTEVKGLTKKSITAVLRVAEIKDEGSVLKEEIKAATYHGLEIREKADHCELQVIFDI